MGEKKSPRAAACLGEWYWGRACGRIGCVAYCAVEVCLGD